MSNVSPHEARLRSALAVLFLLAALVACDQQAVIDRFTPKEEAAFAKRVLAQVAARNFAEVEKQLDSGLRGPNVLDSLEQMSQQFPAGEPKSIRTVGAFTNENKTTSVVTYSLTFEYEYPSSWLVAQVILQRRGGELAILGLHANRMDHSLEESNRFSLAGKSATHYVIFALAIAIPIFIVYVLVLCFKTPIPKRKWPWYIFIALGLVQISFDWTSGAWSIQPISFLLLGAGFHQSSPVGPLVLAIALPIGALVFLVGRRSLGRAA